VERLLALWIEELSVEQADGSSLRSLVAVLDALVSICPFVEPIRLGFITMPIRGPSRFFGGDDAVMDTVAAAVRDVTGYEVSLGVAEGLFCAELAARQRTVVPAGGTRLFRHVQPLAVLGHKELTTTARRLGLVTVGEFAELAPARVTERFSRTVQVLHRVARGELYELPTQRDKQLLARLRTARGEDVRAEEQMGFFGQRSASDDRAQAAAHRLRHRLGVDGVLVADVRGGRSPDDRAALVPWGAPRAAARDEAPWPGQLGSPAPTTSFRYPVRVEVLDGDNQPVRLGVRGAMTGTPSVLVLERGVRRRITWCAGPWLFIEQWWAAPRRRAHAQVILETGEAMLVTTEGGQWWLTGMYD
jgi:nucleotidyltransferase/DNA polymerase involved in DNA repair